jgi:hypothetical protein
MAQCATLIAPYGPFGGLFARAYELDEKLPQQVFPGVAPKDLAPV